MTFTSLEKYPPRAGYWQRLARKLPKFRQPDFATFWNGPLDALTYTCLATFPYTGTRLRLYTYAADLNVPDGVELADARTICPDESFVDRYIAEGRVSLAKFSNLFRYEMIARTGACWVDTDIICLRRPDFSKDTFVFGRQSDAATETAVAINGAVLKLPKNHRLLADLIDRAKAVIDIDQHWGIIGPQLITELTKTHGVDGEARDTSHFYPIPGHTFWKPFLPDYRGAVEKAIGNATFLHLWHELFRRSGYDKNAAAPIGSFFHDLSRRVGTFERFSRVYDATELRSSLTAWIQDDADQDTQAARPRFG